MPEVTNIDRTKWAMAAVQTFADVTGLDTASELETAIGDLLADIMHLCDAQGIEFDERLDNARMHHDAEAAEAIHD